MAIRLVVDSASDITQKEAEELGIVMIPMGISFSETEEYYDGVSILPEDFYPKLASIEGSPKTSQITSFRFKELFRELTANGDEVLAVVMSSKLSGTYTSAYLASTRFDNNVRVVDSLNASIGQKILCLYALELIKQNKSLGDIEEELNIVKHQIEFVALVDTLEYLKRGGRVSSTAATIGTLLSIKPMIAVIDGEVIVTGKAIGLKKGFKLLNSVIKKKGTIDFSKPALFVYSGNDTTNIDKYICESHELFHGHLDHMKKSILGSTIGTHVGPGAIGVAFFVKK